MVITDGQIRSRVGGMWLILLWAAAHNTHALDRWARLVGRLPFIFFYILGFYNDF